MDDDRVGPDVTADLVYGAVATWTTSTGWNEAGTSLQLQRPRSEPTPAGWLLLARTKRRSPRQSGDAGRQYERG